MLLYNGHVFVFRVVVENILIWLIKKLGQKIGLALAERAASPYRTGQKKINIFVERKWATQSSRRKFHHFHVNRAQNKFKFPVIGANVAIMEVQGVPVQRKLIAAT